MAIAPKSFLYAHDAATGVATITLNRPERLNALDLASWRRPAAVAKELDGDLS